MKGFALYKEVKVRAITGRYLPPEPVYRFLETFKSCGGPEVCGYSVGQQQIQALRFGRGMTKVLLWSQMHGNESTTTKGLLDLLQHLRLRGPDWAEELELLCVPVLNPDGARAYTRLNANGTDLNRDAQDLSQPESRALRSLFDTFRPDFCFNLHDQRSIYGVETPPKPATISFLAPAADPEKHFSGTRKLAAGLIGLIAEGARDEIGIGRYDDTFNPNCVGDSFQAAGTPTLLLEAGHYPGDYQRETTRFYVYQALFRALEGIAGGAYKTASLSSYHAIPENTTPFVDILVQNAQVLIPGLPPGSQVGLQFEEVLREGKIVFRPRLNPKGPQSGLYGHQVLDAAKREDLIYLNTLGGLPRPKEDSQS